MACSAPANLRNASWHAAIRSNATAISALWRILTLARPPRLNGFCSTPASPTRSAKCTMARRRWTGWSRSKNAGSPSPRPRRPVSGRPTMARAPNTASTSSTLPDTLTSPSKSNAPCACSMARSPVLTAWPGLSPSPKPYGVRPTNTASPACASSISWIAPAQTSNIASSRSSTVSARVRRCFIFRSASKPTSRVWSISSITARSSGRTKRWARSSSMKKSLPTWLTKPLSIAAS